jgi:hypothetical protein
MASKSAWIEDICFLRMASGLIVGTTACRVLVTA